MKWRPCGTITKASNLLMAVAVLGFCKLLFLAAWGGAHPPVTFGNKMVEAVMVAPAPAFAQTPEVVDQGAQETQVAVQGTLPEEWQALRRRQEEVQRREQAMQALERELDAKLNRLQELENRIQGMLDQADVVKDQKMKHLVDVYTNMKPKEAAKALEVLEEPVAVKILSGMRGRNAGEVLSFVDAEKAARLTEALTRMQVPFQ